jgi:hypothetical protein
VDFEVHDRTITRDSLFAARGSRLTIRDSRFDDSTIQGFEDQGLEDQGFDDQGFEDQGFGITLVQISRAARNEKRG